MSNSSSCKEDLSNYRFCDNELIRAYLVNHGILACCHSVVAKSAMFLTRHSD